jgi:hypothetical protein
MPSEERKTSMRANCGRWHKGVDVRRMLVSCQRTTVVGLVVTHAYTLVTTLIDFFSTLSQTGSFFISSDSADRAE